MDLDTLSSLLGLRPEMSLLELLDELVLGLLVLNVSLLGLVLDASLLGLLEAALFVDVDLLAAVSWTADTVFFVDADLLLVAVVAAGWGWWGWVNGGREGLVMLFFVTFPSEFCRLGR